MESPAELAHSLLDMDITAMKIWPFDFAAEESKGQYISSSEMKKALLPFEKIREAVSKVDVFWNKPQAIKICNELEQFNLMWIERYLWIIYHR